MSEENVEIVRRLYEAFNRRDIAFLEEWSDPEVRIDSRFAKPVRGAAYFGYQGMREWLTDLSEAWEDFTAEIVRVVDLDSDRVFDEVLIRGTGATSRVEVEQRLWHVVVLRNGRLLSLDTFLDGAEALEAAGLSE